MSSSSRRGRVLRGVSTPGSGAGPLDVELAPVAPPAPVTDSVPALVAVDEGYEAGYERGHAEGVAAGRAAAAAEAAEVAARLERALRAVTAAAADLRDRRALDFAGLEDDIAAAAFTMAEALVGRELATAAVPGVEAVARALRLAPPGVDAVVRLHPADADEVRRALNGPSGDADPSRRVTLVADPGVEAGGCVVDAGDCRVDAQLGSALARVRAALLGQEATS